MLRRRKVNKSGKELKLEGQLLLSRESGKGGGDGLSRKTWDHDVMDHVPGMFEDE